jgi:hypothetical protein
MIFQEVVEGKAGEYAAYATLTPLLISMNFILSGKPLQKPTTCLTAVRNDNTSIKNLY